MTPENWINNMNNPCIMCAKQVSIMLDGRNEQIGLMVMGKGILNICVMCAPIFLDHLSEKFGVDFNQLVLTSESTRRANKLTELSGQQDPYEG
jgi:hypothetical protein